MKIKEYSDLKKVEDNMIVDITELDLKIARRVVDFLAGLTFKKGSLKKIEKGKFLVRIGD